MQISDLPYKKERTVIINVNTLLCTTLAILSVHRYLDMPLLVIDCPLNGKSDYENLKKLQSNYGFELLQLPLKNHGSTLDDLMLNLNSDYICLVDSDLEILNDRAIKFMRELMFDTAISTEHIFGTGMIQVSGFGLPPMERYFHKERMWIPLTYLNRKLVAEEIKRGTSFNIIGIKNYKGKLLYKLRNKANKLNFKALGGGIDWLMNVGRKEFKSRRIDILHYDTGALLYERLKNSGKHFLGWTFYDLQNFCKHYCGVTRARMYENEPVAMGLDDIEDSIINTLESKYNLSYSQYYEL